MIGQASLSSLTAGAPRADRNERVIEGQKRALELALNGASLAAVLDAIVRTVEDQSENGVLGSILLLDEQGSRLRHGAAPSLPAAYSAAIDGIVIGPAVGSCGTAAFKGQTVVVEDVAVDPLWAAFKGLALEHGLRACWSTPIFSGEGKVLGTFALYHRFPATPSARDQEIVALMGSTAALVIEREQQARRRAAADEAIRRGEERQLASLRMMFERAPMAIAVMRGERHVIEVANSSYVDLVGHREVLGKGIREAIPELEGQGYFELLDRVRQSGEPYVGRAQRVMWRRGPDTPPEEGFVDFVYQPIPGPDGKTESTLAVAYEVTEVVKAKLEAEAARARAVASEQGLRDFIDNLPSLAWTAEPDGHIDYYNRRWYEYTGTTFEEMQGWGWQKVHDPELLPKVVERWKHSLATGQAFEMEFTLRRADGAVRWFLTRVAPARDASGKIVRWVGTNTDIDDIKAAQALSGAMAEQSLEMEHALLAMRAELERSARRVAELEGQLRA